MDGFHIGNRTLVGYNTRTESNGLYFPGLHAFSKVLLKLNENCGSNIKNSLLNFFLKI